jgi:beta-lactamase class C
LDLIRLKFAGEQEKIGATMPILTSPPRPDKPKLLDQVRDVMRRKHYLSRTKHGYVDWIKWGVIEIAIGFLLIAEPARAQVDVEQIVAQKVQPILPESGKGGGVAVAVRMNGETRFFNYGFANLARNERLTADSIFNLGSVGKLFATTLLAEAANRGELSLDDSVAKYVTDLERGGDIRRVTLGQLASHTSGLPRVPHEPAHRGKYTWPDFVRFLNSWKADKEHEPGGQYLYSNAAMVLLRVALERRFNTRFAAAMRERITGPLGLNSTALPLPRDSVCRAVQGYGPMGRPTGH